MNGPVLQPYQRLNKMKEQQYATTDKRLWELLRSLTDREIRLISITQFAKEGQISKSTLYHHREVYQALLEKKCK